MGRRVAVTSTYARRHTYKASVPLNLLVMDCSECGIPYGFSESFETRRRDDGAGWYCPNGHNQYFTDNAFDKERKLRKAAEAELATAREQRDRAKTVAHRATDEAAHQRRVAAGHKAYATRIKNRILAGVCPWCHRSFGTTRMTRHINSKHPAKVRQWREARKQA